jgi:hypothetical protein
MNTSLVSRKKLPATFKKVAIQFYHVWKTTYLTLLWIYKPNHALSHYIFWQKKIKYITGNGSCMMYYVWFCSMSVNDFVRNSSHFPIWCNTKRFILVLIMHGQSTTINISWHVLAISWRNWKELKTWQYTYTIWKQDIIQICWGENMWFKLN